LTAAVPAASPGLTVSSVVGRWVIAASVLGTGIVFLDGTVVNTALPDIARDLDADLADLQWVMSGYLLTLGSLLVIGGSLGDLFGRRRMFMYGLLGFGATSLLCGVAPSVAVLIAARCLQGVAAALLVPESLAIISASFRQEDRGRAIGVWSGLGAIATAIGPFLGGWLIDSVSWRLVFLINLPLVAITWWIASRYVPETFDADADRRVDVVGGAVLALGLAAIVAALIEGPPEDWSTPWVALGAAGVAALGMWLLIERRSSHPMVPLVIFRSRQFSGANGQTFLVYAGIGAMFFLLVVYLQTRLGYSALEAGASLLPITVILLALSTESGDLAQRIGPRLQMTVGPLVIAAGMLLLAGIDEGSSYLGGVLPGVAMVGLGLAINLAPLTTAVLAAVDDHHAGVGSAINNAVARVAGLVAIAVMPAAAGFETVRSLDQGDGFERAMVICAVLSALGGFVAYLTIRRAAAVRSVPRANPSIACEDPCLREAS
jgi:EmrB/QacA subfamily drug resistance transporter